MGKDLIHPVILCGGGGTRLWPLSRKEKPKSFLPLLGDKTPFRTTLERCSDPELFTRAIVVAGPGHLPLVEEQAGNSNGIEILVEPASRNTAPAIALAAMRLDPDAVMLVCPSDHHIPDTASFQAAAVQAATLARDDWLTTLGIVPDRPETGYGYIKHGEPLDHGYRVAQFVEKPNRARAEQFIADGSYSWNSGIFAFRAGKLLEELRQHRPGLAAAVAEAVELGHADGSKFYPDAEAFAAIEGESIDYAVMENTTRAAMVPVDMGWSDIGNWAALQDAFPRDAAGNHVSGSVELVDCSGVLAISDGPRISAIGLKDICIVVDGDEVLVTSRDGAQLVGKLGGASEQ